MFKYKYQSDLEKYGTTLDIWEVISPDADGVYRGDCESYALTIKHIVDGFEDWDLWYCKLNGEGHCVLRKGSEIIDCNIKMVVDFNKYNTMFNVTGFRKYNVLQIMAKRLICKGFLWWKSIKG